MATSNLAVVYVSQDDSRIVSASSHRLQVWDPSMPTNTDISTALNSYVTQAVAINSQGSVGIGSTRPRTRLDVTGTLRAGVFSGDGSLLTNVQVGGNSQWVSASSSNIYFLANVGVGTTNPAAAKLHIVDNGSNLFRVTNTSESHTSFFIDSNGNVGLGTNSPISSFDMNFKDTNNSNIVFPPGSIFASNVSQNEFTFLNAGYGTGTYTTVASSGSISGPKFNYTGTVNWEGGQGLYEPTGTYTGGVSTAGYNGEYIQLKFPGNGIVLSSYSIKATTDVVQGNPKRWRMYGSTDGSSWVMLDERSAETFTSGQTRNFTLSSNANPYNYYRLVINEITLANGVNNYTVKVVSVSFFGYPASRRLLYVTDNAVIMPPDVSRVAIGNSLSTVNAMLDSSYSIRAQRFMASSFVGNVDGTVNLTLTYQDGKVLIQPQTGMDGISVLNTGSVGIGTTTPRAMLEINGSTRYVGSVGIGTTVLSMPLRVEGMTFFAGNVGIGTTNVDNRFRYMLQLTQDSAAKPGTSTWATTSDARLKEDIVTADYDQCQNIIRNLDLKYYKWRDDIEIIKDIPDRHKLGWIADEVQQVFPKAVRTIPEMYGLSNVLDLNVDQIYAAMYGAIKKLMARVEYLRARIRAARAAQTP